jgi:5-methylthioadenosine/S-adenosylhomocysteine deaminase
VQNVDHIIYGDYVITMGPLDVIKDGALAVKDGRIVSVGSRAEVSEAYRADSVMEGAGRAVLPGLINTHTHAAMALLRGMADDLPLKEWLNRHVWPTEAKWLAPDFIRDGVELACLEMLKAGITTYNDMYFFEDTAAEAAKGLGMRAVLGAGILDFPTKVTTGAEDCLKKADEFVTRWKGDALITPCIAPHSLYTCGPETLKKSKEMAQRHGVGIHTHLSETEWEVYETKNKHNLTPGKYLDSIGFLNDRVLAAHCVWLTDEEIEILAERKVGVSHCVESNLKLASGIAPVAKMLKAGLRVSFGTDGAASNNDLNVLSEMSTAAKLHKAISRNPTVLDARTVLRMATLWGAEALGLGALCGSLEAGKAADVVVVNIDKPHLTPVYNICSHMVYSMRASDVETVMVNGRMVVERGRLLTADEGEILDKARRWGKKIEEGKAGKED